MLRPAWVDLRRATLLICGNALAVACFAADPADGAPSTPRAPNWPSGSLAIPVDGVAPAALRNTFDEGRAGHRHNAIDIPASRGTKVFAVDDGKVAKLFTSVPGGLTIYQFDSKDRIGYYYAHLDRYADGLREGMPLHRCDLIGYVGSTGNAQADAPHLHFAAFLLGPERHWWQGTALNPLTVLRTRCR